MNDKAPVRKMDSDGNSPKVEKMQNKKVRHLRLISSDLALLNHIECVPHL